MATAKKATVGIRELKAKAGLLISEGPVRPSAGTRYLPKPTKLRGVGKKAADYVSEDRR